MNQPFTFAIVGEFPKTVWMRVIDRLQTMLTRKTFSQPHASVRSPNGRAARHRKGFRYGRAGPDRSASVGGRESHPLVEKPHGSPQSFASPATPGRAPGRPHYSDRQLQDLDV